MQFFRTALAVLLTPRHPEPQGILNPHSPLCLPMSRCLKVDSFFGFPEATQSEGPELGPHLCEHLLTAEVLSLHGQWRARESGGQPGATSNAGPTPQAGGGPLAAASRDGGSGSEGDERHELGQWAEKCVSRLNRLVEVRVTKALLESSGSGKMLSKMSKAGGSSGSGSGGRGMLQVADAARQVVEAWKARLRQP